MTPDHILNHFRETDALLEGHFILSSGLHSPKYLQCALALQYPSDAAAFGRAIAEKFSSLPVLRGVTVTSAGGVVGEPPPLKIDTIASPAIGGLVIGFAVAQALNARFIWTERQEGVMTLRRGFSIKGGERILVVEDVITTGGSTRECIDALEKHGAKVVSAASIIDRSNGEADVGVTRIALVSLDVVTYPPEECPICESGSVAYKPGSRK